MDMFDKVDKDLGLEKQVNIQESSLIEKLDKLIYEIDPYYADTIEKLNPSILSQRDNLPFYKRTSTREVSILSPDILEIELPKEIDELPFYAQKELMNEYIDQVKNKGTDFSDLAFSINSDSVAEIYANFNLSNEPLEFFLKANVIVEKYIEELKENVTPGQATIEFINPLNGQYHKIDYSYSDKSKIDEFEKVLTNLSTMWLPELDTPRAIRNSNSTLSSSINSLKETYKELLDHQRINNLSPEEERELTDWFIKKSIGVDVHPSGKIYSVDSEKMTRENFSHNFPDFDYDLAYEKLGLTKSEAYDKLIDNFCDRMNKQSSNKLQLTTAQFHELELRGEEPEDFALVDLSTFRNPISGKNFDPSTLKEFRCAVPSDSVDVYFNFKDSLREVAESKNFSTQQSDLSQHALNEIQQGAAFDADRWNSVADSLKGVVYDKK